MVLHKTCFDTDAKSNLEMALLKPPSESPDSQDILALAKWLCAMGEQIMWYIYVQVSAFPLEQKMLTLEC